MNPSTQKALDRLLRKMAKPPRVRKGRFSTAPFMLLLGLILGYQLLVRLVPRVWATMLPGGWEQAATFRGWPGLVWGLAVSCHHHFNEALITALSIFGAAVFVCGWVRPLRILVWLTVVGVILLDAGIVYVALRTSLEATAAAAGMG